MNTFDKYLLKKDEYVRRRINIDNSLYDELVKLEDVYDASINKLVNIAILEMIETKNVQVYENEYKKISEPHNFAIRKTSYTELEKMKDKFGLSIFKLINIAIYNAINSK